MSMFARSPECGTEPGWKKEGPGLLAASSFEGLESWGRGILVGALSTGEKPYRRHTQVLPEAAGQWGSERERPRGGRANGCFLCGVLSEWRARSERLGEGESASEEESSPFSSCRALPGPRENCGL